VRRLGVGAALALLTVYLAWGSTYLAIRVMVEALPPFTFAGVRSVLAGLVLVLGSRALGARGATAGEWLRAARAGLLLSFGGHALVCFAEQEVASGTAALVMASIPGQLVVWSWLLGGERPSLRVATGLVLGLVGVALVTGTAAIDGSPLHLAALVVASVSWSLGSLDLADNGQHSSATMALGMAVAVGGAVSSAVGLVAGETAGLVWSAVPVSSWLALAYLVGVGSVLAGGLYVWLLRRAPVGLVGTYAFVNPVVAVLLGVVVAGERFTGQMGGGAAVLLVGVALVLWDSLHLRAAGGQEQSAHHRGGVEPDMGSHRGLHAAVSGQPAEHQPQ